MVSLGCLGEVEGGSRLHFHSISPNICVATSRKILLRVLAVSPLHYFNCNVVYTDDLAKIAWCILYPLYLQALL